VTPCLKPSSPAPSSGWDDYKLRDAPPSLLAGLVHPAMLASEQLLVIASKLARG
jgi:hypothetical protein